MGLHLNTIPTKLIISIYCLTHCVLSFSTNDITLFLSYFFVLFNQILNYLIFNLTLINLINAPLTLC